MSLVVWNLAMINEDTRIAALLNKRVRPGTAARMFSEKIDAVDVFASAISDPNLAEKIAVRVDNEIAMNAPPAGLVQSG